MAAAASTAPEASALSGAHFVPAEVGLRGTYGGGLGTEAPAARPSWVRRVWAMFASSVWAPVAVKLLAAALGMLALAGVGIASIWSGVGGVQVPLAGALGSDIHAAWLANKPMSSAAPSASGAKARAPDPSTGTGMVSAASGGSAGSESASPASAAATASTGMTNDGKVILNLATLADLRHLPGVGAKRADAILALRARLGRFKSVNDLMRVKGIGVRGLKKILPHVVLDAPKSGA